MKSIILSMGCLSSRSTITPTDRGLDTTMPSSKKAKGSQISGKDNNNSNSINRIANDNSISSNNLNNDTGDNDSGPASYRRRFNKDNNTAAQKDAIKIPSELSDTRPDLRDRSSSLGASADDEIMSIFLLNQEKSSDKENNNSRYNNHGQDKKRALNGLNNIEMDQNSNSRISAGKRARDGVDGEPLSMQNTHSERETGDRTNDEKKNSTKGSFDEEPNVELLRQYITVDYEISQLEDKDALRVYHEKIEQLEQLERELDMISTEAEEVAVRSESSHHLDRLNSLSVFGSHKLNQKMDMDNNSFTSGSVSTTRRYLLNNQANGSNDNSDTKIDKDGSNNKNEVSDNESKSKMSHDNINSNAEQHSKNRDEDKKKSPDDQLIRRQNNSSSYSTIEDVFNRKIILEKERDKLKKEVEIVIVECDKLQHRYKKRDEILDKLFDGRTGNGLENHLEQQLNWLLEQKHYVDQVFYAWKRAETLTSQTCEQFASALDLLKKLPKVDESGAKEELAKSIGSLLAKSRQDMEQAQKYNPNVDAPFFTDYETERFDKIIETVSSNSISPSEYSQILTVIQFAYKRAVSIRLWLEQILQTTIARDSFELAEEYKWIAIQLRKERINLIKSKLQDPPYLQIVEQIQEQIARQQSVVDRRQQNEINRDSGVESETNDIDIEEEIYRLLELNKSRLEATSGIISNQLNQNQSLNNGNNNNGQVVNGNDYAAITNNRMSMIGGGHENGITNVDNINQRLNSIQQDSSQQFRHHQPKVSQLQTAQNGQTSSDVNHNHTSYLANSTNIMRESRQQQQERDELMRYRIQQRVKGEPLHMIQQQILATGGATRVSPPDDFRIKSSMIETNRNSAYRTNNLNSENHHHPSQPAQPLQPQQPPTASASMMMMTTNNNSNNANVAATTNSTANSAANSTSINPTPTKLKIELDEEARQTLLKQVDQIHIRHKSRIERLRGNNRAKASTIVMNKMLQARESTANSTENNAVSSGILNTGTRSQ